MNARQLLVIPVALLFGSTLLATSARADEVVAFWGFIEDYDFDTDPTKQDFAGDVDNTTSGDANLQAFRGDEDDLDDNGGGGFVSYTSPVSGLTYDPTRTVKWDDLKGGGDDFDIGGTDTFTIDKKDGAGPVAGLSFDNDALMYITLNGTGFRDFSLRFDIEATPGDLPTTFDIFYRTTGAGGVWFREVVMNNIPLAFADYDPADPENMFADSGVISLPSELNDSSTIELIVSDFNENGNSEMEIDNIEIVGNAIPEPASALLLVLGVAACGCRCGRR